MPSLTSPIPFIDFEGFGDGSSLVAREIGQKFYTACRDVGFAYLINHGIPEDKIEGMSDMSQRFFALPYDVKMLAPHPTRGDHHRGYSGIGVEQVSQMVFDDDELAQIRKKAPDHKESYDMGEQMQNGRLSKGREDSVNCPNVWLPDEELPGLRATAMDFMAYGRQLQKTALKALALGMPGVPTDFFEEFHSDGENQLRLLHYPAAPRQAFDDGEKGRIGAHTDFGTCTFLFQDDCGGLEVEDPNHPGTYIAAPPVPGAIVFNIGDCLMRWSNDDLRSTMHRVRAPPRQADNQEMTRERYSIPYFCSPNRNTEIVALPGTCTAARPAKYPPIAAGDYLAMRLNATYKK